MNKNRGVELFCRTPDRLKGGVVQIYGIDAARDRTCIHMGPDLRAAQAQIMNATFQFACRQIRILQRDGPQARESLWMTANNFGDVIFELPCEIQSVRWFCPVSV